MLKNILLLFSLLFFFAHNSLAQDKGMIFFEGSWEEAIQKAKTEDKIIFVDAYTTWCGPCKQMKKFVFTEKKVGEFYNENFINLQLDMEKTAGRLFEKKYPVSAYPTLYFIDGDGEVVLVTKGAQNPEKFIHLGQSAIRKNDKSGDLAKLYEEGKRDYQLILRYVQALNKAQKPSLKVANEYLKTQKDLTTPENLAFILEATTEADSKIFDLLIKHKAAIVKISSPEAVEKTIVKACHRTAKKAIEYEYFELIQEASEKMKAALPKEGKSFEQLSAMDYYKEFGEKDKYIAAADKLAKMYKKDPVQMHFLAKKVFTDSQAEKSLLPKAEKYAEKAASNGTDIAYYFTHAQILDKMTKYDKAIKVYRKAQKLAKAKEDTNVEKSIEQMIQSIEQKK